jgi:hypothetical protein
MNGRVTKWALWSLVVKWSSRSFLYSSLFALEKSEGKVTSYIDVMPSGVTAAFPALLINTSKPFSPKVFRLQ